MKKTSRVLAILLSFAMVAGMTAGCSAKPTGSASSKDGSSQNTSSDTASTDGGKTEVKPTTLTIWLHEGYVSTLKRWGVDPVSKWIKEKTGVTLDISTGDGANDTTKLSLMISSDDLPDLVNVPKLDPCSITLQNEGLVEDLDALAHQYNAKTMIKMIEENDDISLQYSRFKDGNYWGGKEAPLYVWPDYFVDKFGYESARLNKIQERKAWLVRQDIYEAEGSPDLSNIEDFVKFLEKCKTYKDINGKPVTPMGILDGKNAGEPLQIVYGMFSGRAEEMKFENDTVKPMYTTPEFEQTLGFLNRLYRGGLLDQEVYTETYDQWKDKLKAGNIAVVPTWYWHADAANDSLLAKHPEMQYKAIPAEKIPKAEGIDKPVLNYGWGIGVGFGWRCNYIAKSSKNKEAAINFLDFMSQHETQMTAWYGMPGEYYEPAEAWDEANLPKLQDGSMVVKKTPAYEEGVAKYAEEFGKETGADNFWGFWCNQGYTQFTGLGGGVKAAEPITIWNREQVNKLSEYDLEICKKSDVAALANVDPETKAIVESIKRVQEKQYPKIVMAKSEADSKKAYDEMMNEIKSSGVDKLLASYDTIYNERMLPLIK